MFDAQKATQVAAYFLWKRGGRMAYLKLLKLMYLAERECLLRYDERLTGDEMFSLKFGPVLSKTYDLFKQEDPNSEWAKWISREPNYEFSFKKGKEVNPSDPLELFDCLSKAEISLLNEVFAKYGNLTRWQIRDATHEKNCCPEWTDPHGSALPISLKHLLTAHGKSDKVSDKIIRHVREMDSVHESLRALS